MALWGKTDTLADAPKYEAPQITVDLSDAGVLDLATDTITYEGHGFETGDYVQYRDGGGTAPAGLTDEDYYYAIRIDANNIRLATSEVNAAANTGVDITGLGVGAGHIAQNAPTNIFFVDTTEVGIAANRAKGIQTPGWIKYTTYIDSDSNTRHRVETLIPMKVSAGDAGDAGTSGDTAVEDATVADS